MTIKPPSQRFILSPLDNANPHVFIPYFLAFEVQDQNEALKAISNGITHLTSHMPFLIGEIASSTTPPSPENVIELQPPTETWQTQVPVLQVKLHPPQTLPASRLGDAKFELPASLDEAFTPVCAFPAAAKSEPVVRFQANLVPNGIVLVMSFTHLMFDAIGAGVLVELLAESCRSGGDAALESRFWDKLMEETRLRQQVWGIASRLGGSHSFPNAHEPPIATSPSPDSTTSSTPPAPCKQLTDQCFVFSADRIDKLKTACNYLVPWIQRNCPEPPEEALPSFVSSNDVLTALLCGLITKARHFSKDGTQGHQKQESYGCMMAVDLRRFFTPPLPQTYMGNADAPLRFEVEPFAFAHQEIPPLMPAEHQEKLLGLYLQSVLAIAKTAYTIRTKLAGFDKDFTRHLASFVRASEDPQMRNVLPAAVIVSTLRQLKTYELDFGPKLGRINSFDTGVQWVDGSCVIMPAGASGPEAGGKQPAPWNVRITLNEVTMRYFKDDPFLCWALEDQSNVPRQG